MLIMAASGLSAVSSHAGRQYHFVYEQKNMTEAKSYCREKYTDLATVDNMEDVKTLNNMADSRKMVYPGYQTYYYYRAWIGLYDDEDSWRWSLTNTSFYKPGETEFRRWQTGKPNNKFTKEQCTEMGDDGLWNDISCESSKKAVCIHVRGPDVTFILTNISMTWPAAQSYCREQYTDLASVRNSTENQKVQELIPTGGSVWIGLFRDSWKWSDGSTSSFSACFKACDKTEVGEEELPGSEQPCCDGGHVEAAQTEAEGPGSGRQHQTELEEAGRWKSIPQEEEG
ncbi:uncharacterized protein LOC144537378 isoform X2 [Sander vitreus]